MTDGKLSIVFIILVLLSSFYVAAQDKYIVTGNTINVRSGAGKSFSVSGKVEKGDTVIADSICDNWAHISSGNVQGFVHQDYLKKVETISDKSTVTTDNTDSNGISWWTIIFGIIAALVIDSYAFDGRIRIKLLSIFSSSKNALKNTEKPSVKETRNSPTTPKSVTKFHENENEHMSINFSSIEKNLLPILQNLHVLVIDINSDKRSNISLDFLKMVLFLRKEETLSLYDKFGLVLVCNLLASPNKFQEESRISDDFRVTNNLIDKISEIIDEYLEEIDVTKNKFELNAFSVLTKKQAQSISKIFYDFFEIIIKADGIVTENEAKMLKFLSNYLDKCQAPKIKPIQGAAAKSNNNTLLEELNNLVGMENIKKDIRTLINTLNVNRLRKKEGLPELKPSLHSVFIGPPGTGKTTIARILSKIYHELEILPENIFIETDRSGLVGGYLGQTAIKTDEVINEALNGILFIDEAYTLKREDSDDQYGQEAIDTVLKRMEDHRNSLIVIVAGYENEMAHFINSNPGLKSRFNRYFYFNDYSPSDLTEIYIRLANKSGYVISNESHAVIGQLFDTLYSNKDDQFGNARLVRNVFEKTCERLANRIALMDQPIAREILTTIEAIDIPIEEFINQKVTQK